MMELCSSASHGPAKRVTNYFLVNLSVADLFVTLICMPVAVSTSVLKAWVYGEFTCKFTAYLQGVAVSCSVFSILTMSIDRYLAIRHPMILRQLFNKRVARTVVGMIWVVAAAIFFPMLLVRRLEGFSIMATDVNVFFCVEHWPQTWDKRIYGLSLFAVVYAIPGLLVLVAYTSTSFKLCAATVFKHGGDMVLDRDSKLLQGRRRAAKTLLILAIIFVVCWLPYNIIMLMLDSKDLQEGTAETLMKSLPFTLLLGHANSALNPVLYCFFSRNFRQCVLDMLRGKRRRTSSVEPKSYQRCRVSRAPSHVGRFADRDSSQIAAIAPVIVLANLPVCPPPLTPPQEAHAQQTLILHQADTGLNVVSPANRKTPAAASTVSGATCPSV